MGKIGIISSGVDMLVLFRFLAKQNFEYLIVYDDLGWPWSDKPFSYTLERAQKAIDYALSQGCDSVVVPPVIELALREEKKYASCIVPLRQRYVLDECMPVSAVGNIGFAGEYNDLQQKELFEAVVSSYEPNAVQQQRVLDLQKKKPAYAWSFNFRRKEITMRKFYLTKLSFKDWMVHQSMKAEWRYFKDALVDTIIPTNYGFFAYETVLGKFLNTKKQRFHRLDCIEKQFNVITEQRAESKEHSYGVTIAYTGTLDHLTREKKRMRMLQRGKEVVIDTKHIIL